jgi:hypothetical protein
MPWPRRIAEKPVAVGGHGRIQNVCTSFDLNVLAVHDIHWIQIKFIVVQYVMDCLDVVLAHDQQCKAAVCNKVVGLNKNPSPLLVASDDVGLPDSQAIFVCET